MTRYDGRAAFADKIVPAASAAHLIERPRVMTYLAEAAQRRVTALTAGPGFGKTTALAAWAADQNCAWFTATPADRDPLMLARGLVASLTMRAPGLLDAVGPALDGGRGPDASTSDIVEAFVPALAGALHGGLSSDLVLTIDDLHELDGSAAAVRLISDLCHMAPHRLHLVFASRTDLPFPAGQLRLRGQLHVLAAESLGFDRDETAAMLESVGGIILRPHAATVQALTDGWPAAVRLVAEALRTARDRDRVLDGLLSSAGAVDLVQDLLDSEVSGATPAELGSLLRVGAALDGFNAALLDHLGVPAAAATLGAIRRRGIHIAPTAQEDWYALTPMSREYALARLTGGPDELAGLRVAAARWHAARGDTVAALRYLSLADESPGVVALLERSGEALLAAGHGAVVVESLARIPAALRTPAIDLVEGEACQVRGDWDRAVECLSRLVPEFGPAPAAAAWRLGLIYHMRGDLDRAMILYRRGHGDHRGAPGDRALAAAWGSAAAWLTGDSAVCRELALAAGELAEAAQNSRAQAATHTALAMLAALDGDRRSNDMHYLRALDHAERAGDVLQIIRIRVNRGSRLLEEGYYTEAMAELDAAIGPADLAGFSSLRALALLNRGEATRRLGRLDEAARDFQTALAVHQRLGSRMAAYALTGLGAVHADQGNLSLSRAAFEEALALAQPSGDLQGVVPALAGLALIVAPDDADLAANLANRALASGANLAHTAALLAAGWIAQRTGDRVAAHGHATAASEAARRRRDRAGVAESLELLAAAEVDTDARRSLLREAEAVWGALRCPLPLARTRLALARIDGADKDAIAEIESICRELGARTLAAEAAAMVSPSTGPALSVRTLGGFRVLRRGTPIPHNAWQSRKARDLLKILVARRGLPVPREVLCELLWPEAAPERTSNRLSVAISTIRSVLDPAREFAGDRYVVSGDGVVWVREDNVDVDVESFLRQASTALTTVDVSALAAAEVAYTGDFCEEDQYADWATALRDEARAAYAAVAGALAQRHAAAGESEKAVRYLLRLLACEPYDGTAHLTLVRQLDSTGRHGDARRAYRAYTVRMTELDVDPAPYPEPIGS